ncbi:hypothetical protein [Rhodoligotrophos ferricapiens]|uniref:hypothetical protein n=1 Tax=Rhodoligotrophos ferricapiens TaxID=3069264 RepID=UPI00315CC2B4
MNDDEHGRDPAAGLTNSGTLYVGPTEFSAEDFEEAFALLEDTGALELLDTQPEKCTCAIDLALFEAAERRRGNN